MPKTTAPVKSVPRRPIESPIRPAASDVTETHCCQYIRGLRLGRRTECTNLKHSDHGTNLDRTWRIKELAKVGAGNDPGHDSRFATGKPHATEFARTRRTLDHNQTEDRRDKYVKFEMPHA